MGKIHSKQATEASRLHQLLESSLNTSFCRKLHLFLRRMEFLTTLKTAYQAGLTCADPTEAVQDQHGSKAYQCFYNLEKALDSVEYCVLLSHLYNLGINEKGWRVISSFYSNPSGQIKICNRLTKPFTLHREVRQGSLLSPMLFLLVIDSFLNKLEKVNAGISANGIYTGYFGNTKLCVLKSKLKSWSHLQKKMVLN